MPFQVGSIVEGTVTSIASFGAFIQLPEGKTGLVHISEVADHYVEDIKQYLKEKDKVKVKVISIDSKGKISLSLKQTGMQLKKATRPIEIDWEAERREKSKNMSFEDRMLKFLRDSDERQQQLKKSQESKRGGGFRRGDYSKQPCLRARFIKLEVPYHEKGIGNRRGQQFGETAGGPGG